MAFAATSAFACVENGSKGIVEDNDLYISAFDKSLSNDKMTEELFNNVIDRVSEVYAPIMKEMGGTLKVERKWDDGTVNAYAHRRGGTWNIAMFGGLARHKAITPDAFALVVCHEIGHHIGGAPKKDAGGWWGGSSTRWASNEGQSDYWATLKCFRKVYGEDDNIEILQTQTIPKIVVNKCDNTFKNKKDSALCMRASLAGESLANLFADLRKLPADKMPKFDTPDETVVEKTNHNHPAAQCRIDTYFSGAICEVDMNDDVSQKDEALGTCYRKSGIKTGVRPLCWFKPGQKKSGGFFN